MGKIEPLATDPSVNSKREEEIKRLASTSTNDDNNPHPTGRFQGYGIKISAIMTKTMIIRKKEKDQ